MTDSASAPASVRVLDPIVGADGDVTVRLHRYPVEEKTGGVLSHLDRPDKILGALSGALTPHVARRTGILRRRLVCPSCGAHMDDASTEPGTVDGEATVAGHTVRVQIRTPLVRCTACGERSIAFSVGYARGFARAIGVAWESAGLPNM